MARDEDEEGSDAAHVEGEEGEDAEDEIEEGEEVEDVPDQHSVKGEYDFIGTLVLISAREEPVKEVKEHAPQRIESTASEHPNAEWASNQRMFDSFVNVTITDSSDSANPDFRPTQLRIDYGTCGGRKARRSHHRPSSTRYVAAQAGESLLILRST